MAMIDIPVILYPSYFIVKGFTRDKVSKIYHVAPTFRIVEIREDLKGRGWVRISETKNSDSYMVEEDGWLNVAVEQPKAVEYSLQFMFDKKLERGSLSSTVLVISQQAKLKSYFYFQI